MFKRIKFIAATYRQLEMHNNNDNEESFIMMSNSKNIKKKITKIFIDTKIKKNINKISFQFIYSKIYQLFQQKEADFSKRMQEIKNEIH